MVADGQIPILHEDAWYYIDRFTTMLTRSKSVDRVSAEVYFINNNKLEIVTEISYNVVF